MLLFKTETGNTSVTGLKIRYINQDILRFH